MNCLNVAIAEERIHQVRLLLSMGVDFEFRDKNDLNRTPMIKATRLNVEESAYKIAKIILKYGAKINEVDDNKMTALHHACESGKNRVVDLFLKEDSIELNNQDNKGRTPIMLAAINGWHKIVRTIVFKLSKFDLDIDLRDNNGYTALLHSIIQQHYEIAHDLVNFGNASPTIRDNNYFRNATEWLRIQLSNKLKTAKRSAQSDKTKYTITDEKQDRKFRSSERTTSAMPIVTLDTIDNEEKDSMILTSASRVGTATSIRETAAFSGLLFDPAAFGRHSRPASSVVSSVSALNKSNLFQAPIHLEQMPDISEAASQGMSHTVDGSVYSLSATPQQVQIVIQEDDNDSTIKSVVSNSSIKVPKPKSKWIKGRRSAVKDESNFKNDLVRANIAINEPMKQDVNVTAQPGSEEIKQMIARTPLLDKSSNNMSSVHKLKLTLHDGRKRKISRASSSQIRPHTAALGENLASKEQIELPQRPYTRANPSKSMFRGTTKQTSRNDAATKNQYNESRTRAVSAHSINTLLTKSDVSDFTFVNNYRHKSAIAEANRNMRTLFSLYTDSLLWAPKRDKPISLSLQAVNDPSDKMTLSTEFNTSVSDLASLVERSSIAPSEATSQLQISHGGNKPGTARSRLMSGSATSRASKRSIGGKSNSSGSYMK